MILSARSMLQSLEFFIGVRVLGRLSLSVIFIYKIRLRIFVDFVLENYFEE